MSAWQVLLLLLLCIKYSMLCNFWVRSHSGRKLSKLTGDPMSTTRWASSHRGQTRMIKITKKSQSKLHMCENIQLESFIEFILKVLIFRVFWPITQVYNDTGRGNSAAGASSRYGMKWKNDWWWLQLLCLPASCWVSRFLWPEFRGDTISSKSGAFLIVRGHILIIPLK